MTLDETQLAAVQHAVDSQFATITGGAGTGKTTIIKTIDERLRASGCKTIMCAFAGKAAARLKEATGRETSTIHRMLGFMGVRFTRETLKGHTVIVDEASMVDSELLYAITERNPDRLILVGDQAQLPPVGKGQPFHDIIKLRTNRVYHLTKCYRNKEAVFKAAMAIRGGEQVLMRDESDGEKWAVVQTGNDERTHKAIMQKVNAGWLDFDKDIILCPKNGSRDAPATVESLNHDIAQALLPRQLHERFVAGDRVMNTKNIPEKDVWNGTTGSVHAIDQSGAVWVTLDEPIIDWEVSGSGKIYHKDQVMFTKSEAKDLKLAYALSVHKSQGSQYRRVVFVCLGRDSHALLDRSLIYTAVTRTQRECVVVGEKYAFEKGRQKVRSKRTILQELATR